MLIYAGIDEAGYGPLFGPLVIGRAVFGVETRGGASVGAEHAAGVGSDEARAIAPDLWKTLKKAVCKALNDKRGRIAVNDSKKVKTQAAGIRHLELGVLAFCALGPFGKQPAKVCDWLDAIDAIGERCHHDMRHLPWYHADDARPWSALPVETTQGEVAIARNVLMRAAGEAGVQMLDLGAAVVFEDRFNRMVAATRSKASASFTFVASHLAFIWERYGEHHPIVAVDRQSGRMRYRELLAQCFPTASITVLEETGTASSYRLREEGARSGEPRGIRGNRGMTVKFEVEGDGLHLPVSLASMVSKYTRELMMARFQAWFTEKAPHIEPTAGYATDANRFWSEIEPLLGSLAVDGAVLRRMS